METIILLVKSDNKLQQQNLRITKKEQEVFYDF